MRIEKQKDKTDKFIIIHFGNIGFSRIRSIEPLIGALSQLKARAIINEENFELSIYGRLLATERKMIRKAGLEDVIKCYGYIDRAEGIAKMRNACDALLFYGDPSARSVISSKLVEYIFMDKPILGICKGNDSENIITQTNTGLVVGFSQEAIAKGFEDIMNFGELRPNWTRIMSYSREEQTKQLIEIIENI
jgi:glycosyltransferase involved in cell wall biosynthesis